MKQGILPRNHLPVKAVIGVMGAAVRHISWSPSFTITVLGVYEVWALCQSAQKLLWLQSNKWHKRTFPCIFTFNCKQLVFRHPQTFWAFIKIRNNLKSIWDKKLSPYLRKPCCKQASWSSSISFGFCARWLSNIWEMGMSLLAFLKSLPPTQNKPI